MVEILVFHLFLPNQFVRICTQEIFHQEELFSKHKRKLLLAKINQKMNQIMLSTNNNVLNIKFDFLLKISIVRF
jgi:hypothetical protein